MVMRERIRALIGGPIWLVKKTSLPHSTGATSLSDIEGARSVMSGIPVPEVGRSLSSDACSGFPPSIR